MVRQPSRTTDPRFKSEETYKWSVKGSQIFFESVDRYDKASFTISKNQSGEATLVAGIALFTRVKG